MSFDTHQPERQPSPTRTPVTLALGLHMKDKVQTDRQTGDNDIAVNLKVQHEFGGLYGCLSQQFTGNSGVKCHRS
jgi:hypothetical protein